MRIETCWCREGDSNPYTLRRRILNPLRLPIPPSRHGTRIIHDQAATQQAATAPDLAPLDTMPLTLNDFDYTLPAELIAQSPTAQTVSIIQPLSAAATARLRLGVIVGIPLGVLVLSLLLRLIRGCCARKRSPRGIGFRSRASTASRSRG